MWQLIAHPIASFSSIATMKWVASNGFELHSFVVNPKLVRCHAFDKIGLTCFIKKGEIDHKISNPHDG